MCFIVAGAEECISNAEIEKFAKLALNPNQLNEYHTVPDSDHMRIVLDKTFSSHMIRASIRFFDKLTLRYEARLESQLL